MKYYFKLLIGAQNGDGDKSRLEHTKNKKSKYDNKALKTEGSEQKNKSNTHHKTEEIAEEEHKDH